MNRQQRRANKTSNQANLQETYVQGYNFYQAKSFDQAEKTFKTLLKKVPDHADTHHMLGNIYLGRKNAEGALIHLKKAVTRKPDDATYYNSLGKAFKDLEQYDNAVECFIRAVELQKDFVDPHFQIVTLKAIHPELGINIEELNKKFAGKELAEAYKSITRILRSRKQYDEAILSSQQATFLQPDDADGFLELSFSYFVNTNDISKSLTSAMTCMMRAIALDPDNVTYTHYLSHYLLNCNSETFNKQLKELITHCFACKEIDLQNFAGTWISFILTDPELKILKKAVKTVNYQDFSKWMDDVTDYAAFHDEFLLHGLKQLIIPNMELERFFTFCRRYLLDNIEDSKLEQALLPFISALAEQCFFNEYVYSETTEEKEKTEALIKEICNDFSKMEDSTLFFKTAILSCYRPLFQWADKPKLQKRYKEAGYGEYAGIFKVQLEEPLEEKEIIKSIKSFSEIENEISQKVREQYEENPYPRWNSTKAISTKLDGAGAITNDMIASKNDVLIAGCGTGRQAINAACRYWNSDITAIDLSLQSIAYAIRKTDEFGIKNITYKQGDLLEAGKLNKTFDIIACSGVLHHMEDPMAGWQILTDILKPGGYMKIALYSEIARQGILKTHKIVQKMGLDNNPDDIRTCREEIKNAGKDLIDVSHSRDFHSLSSCRDLIFHVQEHRFTIPQIKEALDKLGLRFCKFTSTSSRVLHNYKTMFPNDTESANLDNWHKFEKKYPRTFMGMYQFWVCHAEAK